MIKMENPSYLLNMEQTNCVGFMIRANSGRRFMTAVEDRLILHEKTFPSSKIADLKVFLRLYVWIMLSNFLEMICPAKTTKTMESFKVSTTQFFGLQCHDIVNSSPTFFRSNFLGQTPKETYL